MPSRLSVLKSLWAFLLQRKKWWLAPLFAVLVISAIVILIGESSVIAPIIYTIF